MTPSQQIECALARLGLKSAKPDEAGEFVTVDICTFPGRETRQVWARPAVLPSVARQRRSASGRGLPALAGMWQQNAKSPASR